jgi:5-methylcytosine-specific restriction endonuclease McrA
MSHNTTVVKSEKKKFNSKMIVYIGEFDKYDNNSKLLCRNSGCLNYPKFPYRKYCSKKCNREFERWYYHNFYWERVRSDIFKRDNYTCQICKSSYPYRYRRRGKFVRSKFLECDHIVPRSLYTKLGYKYDTHENKVKATLEFFHNHNNLRTLCSDCHRLETRRCLSQMRGKSIDLFINKNKRIVRET